MRMVRVMASSLLCVAAVADAVPVGPSPPRNWGETKTDVYHCSVASVLDDTARFRPKDSRPQFSFWRTVCG